MRTLALLAVCSLAAPASAARFAGPRALASRGARTLALSRPALIAPAIRPASAFRPASLGSLRPTAALARPAALAVARPIAAAAAAAAAAGRPSLPAIPGAAERAREAKPSLPEASARVSLENGAAALSAPNADPAAESARLFDALRLASPASAWTDEFAPRLRPLDHVERGRLGRAVQLLAKTPAGNDIYTGVYKEYGGIDVYVDETPGARYEARLAWNGKRPYVALTRELMDQASAPALLALLTRELSHAYYRSFPDSAERSWLAHSAMVQAFAEVTGGSRHRWDSGADRYRDGRYVIRAFYEAWSDAARSHDPRGGTYFRWLKAQSPSRSGPNAGYGLEELYRLGRLSWSQYRQMDDYFQSVLNHERNWLAGRDF